jgi:hypothetical protein
MFHPTRVLNLRSVRTRSLMIVIVVLVLAAPALWFVHGTAHGAGACGTGFSHCSSYNKSWTWLDNSQMQRCVVYNAYGYIGYNEGDSTLLQEQYKNITLIDATLSATVYPIYYPIPGVADCNFNKSASVTDLDMTQYWTGYACNFNPSISIGVGFPGWSVGVGGWPNCGTRNRAVHSTSYGSGHYYQQDNTGDPITFQNENIAIPYVGNQEPAGPCYGVYVTSTIKLHVGTSWISDSFDTSKSSAKQVCALYT